MGTRSDFEEAFRRLGQYLEVVEAGELRLVIVGGAALNLLGLVSRTTTDADVIAVEEGGTLVAPNNLPPALLEGVASRWLRYPTRYFRPRSGRKLRTQGLSSRD